MLTAHHLSKTYHLEPILNDISFTIHAGERVGLIGPNGCGKTTLIKILAGMETADQGVVVPAQPDLRIGYLPQGLEPEPGLSLGELLEAARGGAGRLEAELSRLAEALGREIDNPALQQAYEKVLWQMESSANATPPEEVLKAFGLENIDPAQKVSQLSGGQKTRLALALVLLGSPQLLLLDEPTNHLDIQMLEWLEEWLRGFKGAALIVSHDRTFLDRTVRRILELDPKTHHLRDYPGNYSAYLEQYLHDQEKQWLLYRDQVYEIRRMKQDINRTKQQAAWVEQTTTSGQPGVRRYAKKVARKAGSREKKLERYLDSDERVEKPKPGWQMKLEFDQPVHLGQEVWVSEQLAVGYPGYPALLHGLDLSIRAGERIVLTGPNGSGKTTLLRTMAGRLEPLGGKQRQGPSIRLGYMTQEQESLDGERSALETIQAQAPFDDTEGRAFLHYFLFSGDEPLRLVKQLSYGERSRLSLALLVAQGCNFLLLDEPVNHLDIPSRTRFEQALGQFDGTVLAVVHDRYFIERFASRVWRVEDGKIFS